MSLSPRHEDSSRPIPNRPYAGSAVLYAVLAGVIVVVSMLTGGDEAQALLVAAGFWVLATAWSWFRFHRRIAAQKAAAARGEHEDAP